MSKHEPEIITTVNLRGTVTVAELAQLLDVSDQTVRRIAKPMVKRGDIRKVHGALVSTQNVMDPPFLARMNKNRAAKVAIANALADLIQDGSSLAIDTGSTSGFVAQALRSKKGLTIVTNSAYIASTLSMVGGNRVFMAGTQLRNHDGAAFDRAAFDVISSASVEFAVLSASMVHPTRGFLVFEQCEFDIARAMMEVCERTIMAVDVTKFSDDGSNPSLRLPDLGPDDLIVCDDHPPAVYSNMIGKHQLLIADQPFV